MLDAGETVAVATMTPGRHLMVTDAPPAATDALVDHLVAATTKVPGVQGRPIVAGRFADRYAIGAATRAAVQKAALAVHRLRRVNPVAVVNGAMRSAREDDVELLARWVTRFVHECDLPPVTDERACTRARIKRGEMFLWEANGVPVSTASLNGPTPHGIRISLVYTPPEHRGNGYASACVASLSQRMLQ